MCAVSAPHLKSIFIIALNTGIRLGKILTLHWNQIDLGRNIITVIKTKSGKTRHIPINETLREELLRLKKDGFRKDYLFLNPKTGKPLTTIKTAYKAALRRAGITGLTFHDLRRTFGFRIVEKGADIETTRSLLGHGSLSTTQRYVHSSDERRRKAVELLDQKKSEFARKNEDLLHPRYTDEYPSNDDQKQKATKCLFSMN